MREAQARGRVPLGDVAGGVDAQEVKGQAGAARIAEVAHAVRDRLPRRAEQRDQLGDVVAGALDLGEELVVGQEQRAGEVVGEVDLMRRAVSA